jgi:hypothetical protein
VTLTIGAIIAISALLVAAWVNDWGGIQEKVQAVWGVIAPIFQSVVAWLTGPGSIGAAIGSVASDAIPLIVDAFRNWWDFLSRYVLPILGDLVNIGVVVVGKELRGLYDNIWIPLLKPMFEGWFDILGKVVDMLKNNIVGALKEVSGFLNGEGGHAIKEFIDSLGGTVADALTKLHMIMGAFGAREGPIPYQAKAMGGFAGGLALVGEEGPEIVELPFGSYVHRNGDIPRFADGGSVGSNSPFFDSAGKSTGTPSPEWMMFFGKQEDALNKIATAVARTYDMAVGPNLAGGGGLVSQWWDPLTKITHDIRDSADEFNAFSQQREQYIFGSAGGTSEKSYAKGAPLASGMMSDDYYRQIQEQRDLIMASRGGVVTTGVQGAQAATPVQVNTNVYTGIVVGNQKELANVISKENVHSLTQAVHSGQR